MAVNEKEIKDIIKSILTSTPHISTVATVQKDYEDYIGQKLPYHKLNYNSVEHFLRNISDVCKVKGTGNYAQVLPIITEKSAHINEMVTKQKNGTKPKKFTPRRYSTSNNYGRNYNQMSYNSYLHQQSPPKYGDHRAYESEKNHVQGTTPRSPTKPKSANFIRTFEQRIPDNYHNDARSKNKQPDSPSKTKKDSKAYTVNQTAEPSSSSPSCNNKNILNEDAFNVPIKVQNNLKQLISEFEDGIWCSDLPKQYEKLFKTDLRFSEYGYASLIDMCIELKHIFHYVRPGKDDFRLYDRTKPLPINKQENYTISSFETDKNCNKRTGALPKLDWSDFHGYILDDVFAFGMEIPKYFLPNDTKEGDVMDVVVVEVYDPSKFWAYLGTSDEKTPLDQLMDEIQVFYSDVENQKLYSVPPGLVQEGLYCVQVIYGEYHRAKVIKVLPDCKEKVKVFFIDYGTVCKVPIKGMCFLQLKFANLPAQAMRFRLSNIAPTLKNHPWPRSASDSFRNMINRRDTKIKISYIDWKEEYLCVFLADITESDSVVYINELLVRNGEAVWEDEVIDNRIYNSITARGILFKWRLTMLKENIKNNKSKKLPLDM